MSFVIDPKPQKDAVKEVVHKNGCGALIGYVPNDVERYVHKDYDGGTDFYYRIICPNCGKQIHVNG